MTDKEVEQALTRAFLAGCISTLDGLISSVDTRAARGKPFTIDTFKQFMAEALKDRQ